MTIRILIFGCIIWFSLPVLKASANFTLVPASLLEHNTIFNQSRSDQKDLISASQLVQSLDVSWAGRHFQTLTFFKDTFPNLGSGEKQNDWMFSVGLRTTYGLTKTRYPGITYNLWFSTPKSIYEFLLKDQSVGLSLQMRGVGTFKRIAFEFNPQYRVQAMKKDFVEEDETMRYREKEEVKKISFMADLDAKLALWVRSNQFIYLTLGLSPTLYRQLEYNSFIAVTEKKPSYELNSFYGWDLFPYRLAKWQFANSMGVQYLKIWKSVELVAGLKYAYMIQHNNDAINGYQKGVSLGVAFRVLL